MVANLLSRLPYQRASGRSFPTVHAMRCIEGRGCCCLVDPCDSGLRRKTLSVGVDIEIWELFLTHRLVAEIQGLSGFNPF